ncbi:pyrroloquinoline quinone-dependent dehydrogenase [Solimonas sp. K1W22B-7]|uniref:pyrroloquinoline quinone-dependent dehydrogenase n=1 Tax=Solimonas sp. K1W22B-7 TaxID=2303331 RepID=UPI000E32ECFA|nr:pyrroloquinoline quinone-dependent dehydrogenase [Solimonas sp. K1W22B-7]AXQ31507.1 pyrroloquinoline quinone-dependent dehydrogenase [Solimonas sp. K1W22B-7]
MSIIRIARRCRRASLLALLTVALGATAADPETHQMGTKYSPLKQINKGNVANLELAWEYHTGEVPPKKPGMALIAFEDQPSLVDGNLLVCTTSRRVIALDPATGKQRWVFDPKDPKLGMRKCRGISHWVDDKAAEGSHCKSRMLLGTADYRLVAFDSKDGKRCENFGSNGEVKMKPSKPELFAGEVVAGSKPAVVNGVVVVGSAVADNQRVDAPSGQVLAFDARSGKALWSFDPLPRDPADPAAKTWAKGTAEGFGAGNVWANMAVDQKLDLVYLPTTSPSGDFYGGTRAGDNRYSSSIVALRGSTGQVVWHFQFVHHNVFDYDTPSEPLLIDWKLPDGSTVPALVQNNKTGLIFVFNRATGEPLVPIQERRVSQLGKVAGEQLSPTQPFPVGMPTLAPQKFSPDDAWGFTPIDRWLCRRKAEELNYGAIFTPPSEKGTIFSPSVGGGPNWGGGAYDPASGIMVVPSNRVPTIVALVPVAKAKPGEMAKVELGGTMAFPAKGSPFVYEISPLLSPLGSPCSAPPWAALTAVDLARKKIVWEVPLGSIEKLMPMKPPFDLMDLNLGTPGAGGPLVTAGGLVFIGYTLDDSMRAFDLHTGQVLWKTDLPAAGTAVPVSYEAGGEQYVVIPAGGHSMYGSTLGDSVVAYKLRKR